MSTRVLVTGAAGYLGGALVEALAPRLADGTLDALVATDVREVAVEAAKMR